MFGVDDPDDRRDFLRVIRAMDSVWMEERKTQREREREAKKGKK